MIPSLMAQIKMTSYMEFMLQTVPVITNPVFSVVKPTTLTPSIIIAEGDNGDRTLHSLGYSTVIQLHSVRG